MTAATLDRALGRPDPTPAGLARVAEVLATREALWRPIVRFCRDERWYTRVAGDEGWEAWLLSWLPGQGTGLHGHGGSAGAFAVLQGDLTERTPTSGRELAVGSVVSYRQRVVGAGAVRSFGPTHVHDVLNPTRRRAVSLHVYAPALTAMTRYGLDGDVVVRADHEKAGVDW